MKNRVKIYKPWVIMLRVRYIVLLTLLVSNFWLIFDQWLSKKYCLCSSHPYQINTRFLIFDFCTKNEWPDYIIEHANNLETFPFVWIIRLWQFGGGRGQNNWQVSLNTVTYWILVTLNTISTLLGKNLPKFWFVSIVYEETQKKAESLQV